VTATPRHRAEAIACLTLSLIAAGVVVERHQGEPRFLHAPLEEFAARFAAPPAATSTQTRRELDELLELQRRRTPRDVEAAQSDRKTDVWQFAAALDMTPQKMRGLRALDALASQVEDDERPYVHSVKSHFRRLRPYELEPRLRPCIEDVRDDRSYPSGHATYGFLIAYLLAEMVPERRAQLLARAEHFARQRMVCGVHFSSDIDAGRLGAAWLARQFLGDPHYRSAAQAATIELRAALGLPAAPN
jgi:acid phosphatase (class A)